MYRLYVWDFERLVSATVPTFIRRRGVEIGSYRSMSALVQSAEKLAAAAGFPGRWHDLYDWDKD